MTLARSLQRSVHGFTLLEVLIAVVVLSVGLLGLAGLQTAGLRQNHSAFMRSQATMLAYDIIDRMRTNKATANTGGYDILVAAVPPIPPVDCVAASCNGAQLASYEVNDWITRIGAALPFGGGAVTRAGSVVTVTVVWDDDRADGSNAANQSFVMSTQI